MAGRPDTSLASMGIYVFNADYLYDMLNKEVNTPCTSHDFGKDVLPKCLEEGTLYAHPFSRSCMDATQKVIFTGVTWVHWIASGNLIST